MNTKNKITFEQFCDPVYRRAEQMKIKSEAVWVIFNELDGLINVSKFSKEYFKKSQSWFAQKLHGLNVCDKDRSFNDEEYKQLSKALRAVAKRLNDYADELDKAENI